MASSSGKLFVEDLTPRTIDEMLVGTARQFNNQWSARLYGRYRNGNHFWEDTNNNARLPSLCNPPAGIPRELYIPDLTRAAAPRSRSGSQLCHRRARRRLHQVLRGRPSRPSGAATRRSSAARTPGATTTATSTRTTRRVANDANIFIGSSFIADGAGRQFWDNKYGDLRGDRRHLLKLYGYYPLPWNATAGALRVAQSGQPWEAWSYEPYIALTTNTSDTIALRRAGRFAPHCRALAARSELHAEHPAAARLQLQIAADLFNVFNEQTGYNSAAGIHISTFGVARNFFDPRRFQIRGAVAVLRIW